MKRVPDPRKRPAEYASVLVGAVFLVLRHVVDLPDGIESDVANLLLVTAPLVTWVVGRRDPD